MSLTQFDVLGKLGAFATVFKVRRKSDNQLYAMKKVKFGPLSTKEKENALNEVRILASFEHPNIIAYKEAFFDEEEFDSWHYSKKESFKVNETLKSLEI